MTGGLVAVGLADTLFLLAIELAARWGSGGQAIPFCGRVGWWSCRTVLWGRWSSWLGLPVAGLGVVVWLVTAGLLWSRYRRAGRQGARWSDKGLAAMAAMLAGAAAWFVGLQAWTGQWCPWCLVGHAAGLAVAGRIAGHLRRSRQGPTKAGVGLGVLGLGLLVAGQVLVEPDYLKPVQAGPDRWKEAGGTVVLMGGKVVLDPAVHPLLGPTGRPVVVEVLDYTCRHCRKWQEQMDRARHLMGEQAPSVLVVMCPLNRRCNPTVKQTLAFYRDACDLAELAMAVWAVDAKQFAVYHRWLFEHQEDMTVESARRRAGQLVGREALDKELATGRARRRVAEDVELSRVLGAVGLPLVLAAEQRFELMPESAERLAEALSRALKPAGSDRAAGGGDRP